MTTMLSPIHALGTSACVQKHFLRSGPMTELYLTAFAPEDLPFAQQADALFEDLAVELLVHDAHIFEERIFVTRPAMDEMFMARARAFDFLDDGVPPTVLEVPGDEAKILGVQVHALAGFGIPEVLSLEEGPLGRMITCSGARRVALSGLSGDRHDSPEAQYAVAFQKAQQLLSRAGLDFRAVARTWWWMRDILDHYAEFNQVRRTFFAGLADRGESPLEDNPLGSPLQPFIPPASTGIGVRPESRHFSALDVSAAIGAGVRTQFFNSAGNQRAASEYGSAFSRASRVDVSGFRTIYVSGTADIDAAGRSCHIGDAKAQIDATLENVTAVLKQLGCGIDDVVQACAYSKTPEIEQIWRNNRMSRRIPAVSMVADVCRDDLLFELEATALVRAPGLKVMRRIHRN